MTPWLAITRLLSVFAIVLEAPVFSSTMEREIDHPLTALGNILR